jgi:hypothetical protein
MESKIRRQLFKLRDFLIIYGEDLEGIILSDGDYQVDLFFTGNLKQTK